ncbi:MAG TPA: long-chain fatty acid--CoA ligase [Candidatus Dormibacteraeota bacterium]|nr:long-chain fatty acid--CoA ligase [Candidatus Dormibacteraeota bacterium]
MASFNLSTMLRESTLAHPDKVALILDENRLAYSMVDGAADRVAQALRDSGIAPGTPVGLMLPNVPQFPIVYFGILRAGCVAVPMNVLLKAPEVTYYLEDSGAQAFFFWDGFAEEAVKGADAVPAVGLRVSVAAVPNTPAPQGCTDFMQLVVGVNPTGEITPTAPEDTAVILYTSGTTGKPKGAQLTHYNLLMNCIVGARIAGVVESDVTLATLPFFHAFGASNVMNTAVYAGGTLSLLPRFEPVKALQMIQRDRITVFAGVPTMYIAFLKAYDEGEWDISTIRMAISGGAALPEQVLREFEEKFGAPILEGYGLSESSPSATFNRPDRPRKVGSIGLPIWGVELKVIGDDGATLGDGENGEICIRGHNVMKGYHNRPEATAETIDADGWLHTGDIGHRDSDGYYFIVDRKKELVIRGGFNVYPREIEEVLYQHPAVLEAAVFGIPDATMGEEVVAAVALRPGQTVEEGALIAFVKERVAAYKYPRRVWLLETLPKGPTGKILKLELKAQLVPAEA